MNNRYGSHSEGKTGKLIRIGIDVDLTLVDTLTPWYEWYNRAHTALWSMSGRSGEFQPITEKCCVEHNSDLCTLMAARRPANCISGDFMDWWRWTELYKPMLPFNGSTAFFHDFKTMLKSHFDEVEFIVVTKCEPEHERSKKLFCDTHFPGLFDGFISTHQKHMVAIDVLIDDNPGYVMPCLNENIMFLHVLRMGEPFQDLSSIDYMHFSSGPGEEQSHFLGMSRNMVAVVRNIIRHYVSSRVEDYEVGN